MKRNIVSKRTAATAAGALTLAATLALGPSFTRAASGPAWSTFHGTASRSGASSVNGPTTNTASARWQLPRGVQSSPVVDSNGIGYVGDDDGRVYQLDPAHPGLTGWFFATGGPVVATPTLSNDGKTIYVASTDGNVYALNTSNGSKIWSAYVGGYLRGSPLLSTDGTTLYENVPYGGFVSIAASGGAVSKQTPINGSIPGSLALSNDGSIIYVATNAGIMQGVPRPSTGSTGQNSPFYLDGEALTTPAVDPNGYIYVTTNLGVLDSFQQNSSAPRWKFTTQGTKSIGSSPAIANNIVYFGGGDGNVYAVHASDGSAAWPAPAHTGANVASSPAIATGNSIVYVGSEDGNVYAFNANTGALIWSKTLGAAVDSSPALAPDGSLWVADSGGQVERISDIGSIPGAPGTPVAATATPLPTGVATSTPTATATATASATAAPSITVSVKKQVKAGTRVTITVKTTPGAVIRFRVNYPNGDHQSHRATANASGVIKYSYIQGLSKILPNRKYANILLFLPNGTTVTKQYKILPGSIDAAVVPRTQKPGKKVTVWVHTTPRTRVVAFLSFPNGRLQRIGGKTGPKGWTKIGYKVGRGLTRGSKHKVVVLARVYNRPRVSTRTTFTIK